MTTAEIERTASHKVIAVACMIGGVFGAITAIPQLNGASFDVMSALAWLLICAQIVAAIFGGWQYWCGRTLGYQIVYWLSWSCVPVIALSVIRYHSAIGMGVFPVLSLGAGNFGANFFLRFGYDCQLYFNSGDSGLTIGVNIVALVFVSIISRAMKASSIPRWPLALGTQA